MLQFNLQSVTCLARDEALHLAFTDLCQYQGRYWLAYREASSHHRQDGRIVLLVSDDKGHSWQEQHRFILAKGELRDPKLSVSPHGELWLNCARINAAGLQSLLYRFDGERWSGPSEIGEHRLWLWRTLWCGRKGLCFGYSRPQTLKLYQADSYSGQYHLINGQPLGKLAQQYGYPNETGLARAHDGTVYCLLRRDADSGLALLGKSLSPYQQWQWQPLDQIIGGPELTVTPQGRLLAVVRLYQPARTSLCTIDPQTAKLQEILELPSGGDTSYAGIEWLADDELLVSYYSSHEGSSAIYLARLNVAEDALAA